MASHGTFHWNELLTADAKRAKQFYSDTIGWTFDAMPMPDGATYWLAMMGGKPVAGIFPTDRPEYKNLPEAWMSYSRSTTSMRG
jgi:predicted enzyme related to lactoylglutathione lyase